MNFLEKNAPFKGIRVRGAMSNRQIDEQRDEAIAAYGQASKELDELTERFNEDARSLIVPNGARLTKLRRDIRPCGAVEDYGAGIVKYYTRYDIFADGKSRQAVNAKTVTGALVLRPKRLKMLLDIFPESRQQHLHNVEAQRLQLHAEIRRQITYLEDLRTMKLWGQLMRQTRSVTRSH